MTQLLTVADIALIKPGGLITTECAYMGIPIILVGKTYAQEDVNRRFLTLARAAEHATTYKGVVNLLCDIFSNEDLYNTLKKNTLKLCRNNASEIIVNKTFDLIENPPSPSHNFGPLYIGDTPVHTR